MFCAPGTKFWADCADVLYSTKSNVYVIFSTRARASPYQFNPGYLSTHFLCAWCKMHIFICSIRRVVCQQNRMRMICRKSKKQHLVWVLHSACYKNNIFLYKFQTIANYWRRFHTIFGHFTSFQTIFVHFRERRICLGTRRTEPQARIFS